MPETGTYIRNGTVHTGKKPWSFYDFILAIINAIRLFVLTIFTTQPLSSHVDEYNNTKGYKAGFGSGNKLGRNVHGMQKPASAGCTGGG